METKKKDVLALNRWRVKGQRLNREMDPSIPVSITFVGCRPRWTIAPRGIPVGEGSHGEIVSAAKDSQP